MTPPPIIEIDQASVRRDGQLILDRVSLAVFAQQPLAIIGPNGCGKSTLIRLMTREIHPLADGGQVRWWGEARWGQADLRGRISVVQPISPAALLADFTVTSMVVSGAIGTIGVTEFADIPRHLMQAAEEQLDRLHISYLAHRRYSSLSAGETQRVLIARALISQPRVLILDEPTTGLDFVARLQLLQDLSQLSEPVEGLVLVTHHFSEITDMYRKVVLMRSGRVLDVGDRAEMLQPSKIADAFGCPVGLAAMQALTPLSV